MLPHLQTNSPDFACQIENKNGNYILLNSKFLAREPRNVIITSGVLNPIDFLNNNWEYHFPLSL